MAYYLARRTKTTPANPLGHPPHPATTTTTAFVAAVDARGEVVRFTRDRSAAARLTDDDVARLKARLAHRRAKEAASDPVHARVTGTTAADRIGEWEFERV